MSVRADRRPSHNALRVVGKGPVEEKRLGDSRSNKPLLIGFTRNHPAKQVLIRLAVASPKGQRVIYPCFSLAVP